MARCSFMGKGSGRCGGMWVRPGEPSVGVTARASENASAAEDVVYDVFVSFEESGINKQYGFKYPEEMKRINHVLQP